jgi:hypothetical protein
MKTDLPLVARAILNDLLDRWEQPARRRVVRVRLNERDHAAYYSTQDVAMRRETNDALQQLSAQSLVRLHWRKWEEHNWLAAVDLVPENANAVYALLQRTPRRTQEEALRELLSAQTPRAGWHADFLAWACQQLDAHRSIAPLALDTPRENEDLLRALAALADLSAPTLERKFSVQLFGDSKRLKDLLRPMLAVLRRHDPSAAEYGDDDDALLRAHQLERVPEYVQLSGTLVLQTAQAQLDLTPFAPSIALSAATIRAARVVACPARAVVTIENATSFSEFVAVRPNNVLAIFTSGFASPTIITLLKGIGAANPMLSFFHWGDLDVGGLRILAHLRSQIGNVTPLAMDADTFNQFQTHAQKLNAKERDALMQLQAHPGLTDGAEIIQRLIATNRKLEQEAVDAERVIKSLEFD